MMTFYQKREEDSIDVLPSLVGLNINIAFPVKTMPGLKPLNFRAMLAERLRLHCFAAADM